MIFLLNLNQYIGGGEVLLIRLAQYLKKTGEPYSIVGSGERNCWVRSEAERFSLNFVAWPSECDSVNYMSRRQQENLLKKWGSLTDREENLRIFVYCMRDVHNVLFLASHKHNSEFYVAYGLYHPEDKLYLSTLALKKRDIIKMNEKIIEDFVRNKSAIFTSVSAFKFSFPSQAEQRDLMSKCKCIGMPINIPSDLEARRRCEKSRVKIICISRFVEFKVAAVLAMMRAIHGHPKYELSIIGYGFWGFLLDIWIKFHRPTNIRILGKKKPHELDEIIDAHDIGYAQGTAILEIAKRGLPVMIAPYGRLSDIFMNEKVTLGVFGAVPQEFELGDSRTSKIAFRREILGELEKIGENYHQAAAQTVTALRRYDTNVVCSDIVDFIKHARLSSMAIAYDPFKAPMLKRIRAAIIHRKQKWL